MAKGLSKGKGINFQSCIKFKIPHNSLFLPVKLVFSADPVVLLLEEDDCRLF